MYPSLFFKPCGRLEHLLDMFSKVGTYFLPLRPSRQDVLPFSQFQGQFCVH